MKALKTLMLIVLGGWFSVSAVAQEYDDLYFTKEDRKKMEKPSPASIQPAATGESFKKYEGNEYTPAYSQTAVNASGRLDRYQSDILPVNDGNAGVSDFGQRASLNSMAFNNNTNAGLAGAGLTNVNVNFGVGYGMDPFYYGAYYDPFFTPGFYDPYWDRLAYRRWRRFGRYAGFRPGITVGIGWGYNNWGWGGWNDPFFNRGWGWGGGFYAGSFGWGGGWYDPFWCPPGIYGGGFVNRVVYTDGIYTADGRRVVRGGRAGRTTTGAIAADGGRRANNSVVNSPGRTYGSSQSDYNTGRSSGYSTTRTTRSGYGTTSGSSSGRVASTENGVRSSNRTYSAGSRSGTRYSGNSGGVSSGRTSGSSRYSNDTGSSRSSSGYSNGRSSGSRSSGYSSGRSSSSRSSGYSNGRSSSGSRGSGYSSGRSSSGSRGSGYSSGRSSGGSRSSGYSSGRSSGSSSRSSGGSRSSSSRGGRGGR